ncbi:MAG TPA: TIGR04255 family protein [Pyrinomonadaceae bacterium]
MADETNIDPTESFPHLSKAPIVEAAFDIRARAELPWEEKAIAEQLKQRLPEYPVTLAQHAFQQDFQFGPNQPAQGTYQESGLKGFRLQSGDNLHITQFNRDGFVFSRLAPYESWEYFSSELFRLWDIYADLAGPSQIHKLGLRFINRIKLSPEHQDLRYYLVVPPLTAPELHLPFVAFLHQDTFAIPRLPYFVNIVKTIQLQQDLGAVGPALIVDIDVSSEQPFALEDGILKDRVAEMRWLKNKFFFGNITPEAVEAFR